MTHPIPGTIMEMGEPHSNGASDGHIWNLRTGECSPLCPAEGGHSGPLTYDEVAYVESDASMGGWLVRCTDHGRITSRSDLGRAIADRDAHLASRHPEAVRS